MTKRRTNQTPTIAPTTPPAGAAPEPRAPLFRFADLERQPASLGAHQPIHGGD